MDWERFRFGFYATTMAFIVVAVAGGVLLLPFSVGYASAFFVGTALVTSPLWGLQGLFALIFYKNYSKREKVVSLMVFAGMTTLLAVFLVVADARNFP